MNCLLKSEQNICFHVRKATQISSVCNPNELAVIFLKNALLSLLLACRRTKFFWYLVFYRRSLVYNKFYKSDRKSAISGAYWRVALIRISRWRWSNINPSTKARKPKQLTGTNSRYKEEKSFLVEWPSAKWTELDQAKSVHSKHTVISKLRIFFPSIVLFGN